MITFILFFVGIVLAGLGMYYVSYAESWEELIQGLAGVAAGGVPIGLAIAQVVYG